MMLQGAKALSKKAKGRMIILFRKEPLEMAHKSLFRIDGEIITQDTCRLFRGNLAHRCRVIQECRDIIKYGKKTCCHSLPLALY